MSAMLYWSAASHSWSFKRWLSTCAHISVTFNALAALGEGPAAWLHCSQQGRTGINCARRWSAKDGHLAHLVQPVGLIDVSILGVLDLLWRIAHKVVGLRITEVLQMACVQPPQPVKDLQHSPVDL